jgi:hypothetical protein
MRKNSFLILLFLFIWVLFMLSTGCEKEEIPGLTTTSVSGVTQTSAISGGTIISDGGLPITLKGVCWSTETAPTIKDSFTSDSIVSDSGNFYSKLNGLTFNTTYYLRAYATNSTGTGYGNEISFKTSDVQVPILNTTLVKDISFTTATCGGNIISNCGSEILTCGICWSTDFYPDIDDCKTSDEKDKVSFINEITGLSSNTNYYVRAYASNKAGTGYGNNVSFVTLSAIPELTTSVVTLITKNSAQSGGKITLTGISEVTARGVCWSTEETPTISNYLTTDGSGSGSFTSTLTKLTPYTTYKIRAYATNSSGTAYGNEVSFTTSLSIGDYFQGGKVAYFFQPGDPGYDVNVLHGLIASPWDQSTGEEWDNGISYFIGSTGLVLGTGKTNTDSIVNTQGEGKYAAKICYDLELNGYNDWYLPSIDELRLLYINKSAIGGFAPNVYSSSSEMLKDGAWVIDFLGGTEGVGFKTWPWHVRGIRSF